MRLRKGSRSRETLGAKQYENHLKRRAVKFLYDELYMKEESLPYGPVNEDGSLRPFDQFCRVMTPRFIMSNIQDVDTVKQSFDCTFRLKCSWDDLMLPQFEAGFEKLGSASKATAVEGAQDVSEDMILSYDLSKWEASFFQPRICIKNLSELLNDEDEEWYNVAKGARPGTVKITYQREVSARFRTQFWFGEFPLDVQELRIKVQTTRSVEIAKMETIYIPPGAIEEAEASVNTWDNDHLKEIRTKVTRAASTHLADVDPRTFYLDDQWKHNDHMMVVDQGLTLPQFSETRRRYHYIVCAIKIRRHVAHYLYVMFLPLFLITSLAHTSVFCDHEDEAGRLSLTLTMVLAAVAFQFIVSDHLPPVSELTRIEQYINLCMLWMCGIGFENVLGQILDVDVTTERWIGLVILLCWMLINVVLVLYLRWLSRMRDFEIGANDNQASRKQRASGSNGEMETETETETRGVLTPSKSVRFEFI